MAVKQPWFDGKSSTPEKDAAAPLGEDRDDTVTRTAGQSTSAGSVHSAPAEIEVTQAGQVPSDSSLPPLLGEYVILQPIAGGGMGQVFKARHQRMDRLVALKRLAIDVVKSSEAVKRFEREVRALAKLKHPNIVEAYDAGELHGVLYLVMEYVEGVTLKSLVKEKGARTLADTMSYVFQTAKGLEFAHDRGIIHRDVKPSNLILDNKGTVKVLDLGLVRFAQTLDALTESMSEKLTIEGQPLGTPEYMAPEQAEDAARADERSDIYSLGCTLYFLLTGKPPYSADFAGAVLVAHCEAPIPSLRTVREDVPPALDAIFQKMLAKDPQLRFQTVAELISALEAIRIPATASAITEKAPVVTPSGRGKHPEESPSVFHVQWEDNVLVLIWSGGNQQLNYEQLEEKLEDVLGPLEKLTSKNVIVDFCMADAFGPATRRYSSTALGFYLKLWVRLRSINGRMAMCGISDLGMKVLRENKLDSLWSIYPTRQEALVVMRSAGPPERNDR